MTLRKFLIAGVFLTLLGGAGWFGWRWYTTPTPPNIPLDELRPDVAEKVAKAMREVRQRPRTSEPWGELGLLLMTNGWGDQAGPCFVQAHRFAPTEPRWLFFHGVLLLDSNPRESILRLREALPLAREPEDRAAILGMLALTLVDEGELGEAEQRLTDLRALEGDSLMVQFGFGLLALAHGDREGARALLSKLTDAPFTRKRACLLLAGLTAGDDKLAERYRQQAASFPDDQAWDNSYLREIASHKIVPPEMQQMAPYHEMEAQGRHQEALAFLRQFVAETPDEVSCYVLGVTLLGRNEIDEAEKSLRQALTFNPRHVKANLFLGDVLLRQGEKRKGDPATQDEAREFFRQAILAEEKALSFQGDLALAHMTRGRALAHLGRTPESLAALREAVAVGPEVSATHLALGEALAENGHVREALGYLEDAVRLAKPEDTRPRKALEKWRDKAKQAPQPEKRAPGPPNPDTSHLPGRGRSGLADFWCGTPAARPLPNVPQESFFGAVS